MAEHWRIDAFELWCWRRLLRVPWTARRSNQSILKEINISWIFIRRNDAEASILWPPDAKSWLIGKDPDAGKDWKQEKERVTENEMIGWHHQLNGHEFEQTLGDSEGQESLACCSPRGRKELDTTEWLNKKLFQTMLPSEAYHFILTATQALDSGTFISSGANIIQEALLLYEGPRRRGSRIPGNAVSKE